MKKILKKILCWLSDVLLIPFSVVFLPVLKLVRRVGVAYFPLHRKAFMAIGVFPVRDHYYEPQFKYSAGFDAKKIRNLPIDFDIPSQLAALQNFQHKEELINFQKDDGSSPDSFYVNNPNFGPGDAELYYLMIRNCKPKKIVEIGSGFSTKLAIAAVKKNKAEGFASDFFCIEPYEMPWLEKVDEVTLVKERVETMGLELFSSLQENDILFIDSSHIIRPENDVLFVFMEILPLLKPGVMIHIHDIFSPRHYRQDWLTDMFRFWNEQYLLEAFLYNNKGFQILYSLNYLKNDFYQEVVKVLIQLQPKDEPSSFWLKKCKE